ncbi:MAG TPA: cation-transporting P-type ATPase [Kutzneria sp.]|nr:cation-transporting P-type ATPase [Kutzneria sp.]
MTPFIAVAEAATRSGTAVLGDLDTAASGLADDAEAARRRVRIGPNAVRTHRVSAVAVLVRQLRSALLGLPVPMRRAGRRLPTSTSTTLARTRPGVDPIKVRKRGQSMWSPCRGCPPSPRRSST